MATGRTCLSPLASVLYPPAPSNPCLLCGVAVPVQRPAPARASVLSLGTRDRAVPRSLQLRVKPERPQCLLGSHSQPA